MDDRSFDALTRALGGAATRRGAIAVLGAMLAGAGALETAAKRKRGRHRDDATHAAGKRKNRKRCTPACTGNLSCVRQQCVCETALCGAACCAAGQVCQRGRCAGAADLCHDLAESCGDGTPCCDGLQCASGNGGGPVACWPLPGGECEADAECAYGHHCAGGACVADPPPTVCTPSTCAAEGATCGSVPDGCGGTLACGSCSGPQTCGGAGTANACGCAAVTCTGGKSQDPASCQCVCPSGETDCAGTCKDLQADDANCGACGTACSGGATCQSGACACPTGQVTCGGSCVDTQTDDAHCGACNTACSSPRTCASGTCAIAYAQAASFGTLGSTDLGQSDGKLKTPFDLHVDVAGTTAWVADTNNDRVVIWSKSGSTWSHVASLGASGTTGLGQDDGKLRNPQGVRVDAAGTTALISDTNNSRIVVWTKSGSAWSHTASFGTFGNTPVGQTDGLMYAPIHLHLDAAGTAASIADLSHHRIVVWTKSGSTWSHVASFGSRGSTGLGQNDGLLNGPSAVHVDAAGTTAWIADSQNHRIAVWTKSGSTWSHTASFGSRGSSGLGQADGKLNEPSAVAVDAAGTTAWISDYSNSRIVIWTKSGSTWSHVASFGVEGSNGLGQTDGKLNYPYGMSVGALGATVWVADSWNNRITAWAN